MEKSKQISASRRCVIIGPRFTSFIFYARWQKSNRRSRVEGYVDEIYCWDLSHPNYFFTYVKILTNLLIIIIDMAWYIYKLLSNIVNNSRMLTCEELYIPLYILLKRVIGGRTRRCNFTLPAALRWHKVYLLVSWLSLSFSGSLFRQEKECLMK